MSRSSVDSRRLLSKTRVEDVDDLSIPYQHYLRSNRKQALLSFCFVALLSSIVSVFATTVYIHFAFSKPPFMDNEELLPALQIPPLGSKTKVFMPESKFRIPPSNISYDAWMSLFPKGKGYVSMNLMKSAGEIPRFVDKMSTDGSGRFCIAAFHQLHCLYLLQKDLHLALGGQIKELGIHTTHCIDYLKTSLLCAADTNLEPFRSNFDGMLPGNAVDGFGSTHACRNFDELYEWAERFRYNDDVDADRFEG